MKRILCSLLAVLMLSIGLASCSDTGTEPTTSPSTTVSGTEISPTTSAPEAEEVEIYVSAAASLTESLTKIAELYKAAAPNVTLTFNFAASGTLQTQIEENAPADVFISAAQKQMNSLAGKDLIYPDTRKDLLINKVVLIVPASSDAGITSFEDCLTDKVKMIAIGDTESVPVGSYAKEIFTFLGGWDTISAKANLGTDVKQVLSWTASGDVDCGIVYSTDAAVNADVKIVAEAPEGSHSPVIYPAAIIKYTEVKDAAQAFLDFLSTEDAKQIFIEQGFSIA